MHKYTHYITIPVSTSIGLHVETDEKITTQDQAYELASRELDKVNLRFSIDRGEDEAKHVDVQLGEEVGYHRDMNRGNVCVAVCREVDWETEETEGMQDDE